MQSSLKSRAQRVGAAAVAAVFLSFAVATTVAAAVPGPPPTWIKQIGGKSGDRFNAVARDGIGNIVAVGQMQIGSNNARPEPWVVKFNSAGVPLWQQKPASANLGAILNSVDGVTIDKGGNIIVSITSLYPTDNWILKYNSSGTLLWSRRYDSGSSDIGFRVAVDGLGNIYAAGSNGRAGAYVASDAVLIKYSASGTLLWAKIFGTDQNDQCNGIAVDKNNNVLLVGATWGALAGPAPRLYQDAWVAKLNGAGKFLWTRQIDSINKQIDVGNAVAVDANNNVIIGGLTFGKFTASDPGGVKAWLAKYSWNGVSMWYTLYTDGHEPNINGLAVDSKNNNIIATGLNDYFFSSRGAFIAKFTTGGTPVWSSMFNSPTGGTNASAVATDNGGNAYVAGSTGGDLGGVNMGSLDAYLAKFPVR